MDLTIFSIEEKAELLRLLCFNSYQVRFAGQSTWDTADAIRTIQSHLQWLDYYHGIPIKINFMDRHATGALYERDCQPGYKFEHAYREILMQRALRERFTETTTCACCFP